MSELYGKSYSRAELLKRLGSLSQIAGIREYTYSSGRSDGVHAVEINTGIMSFEIVISRCLDISFARYKGISFSYISKSGISHPAYFTQVDPRGFYGNFFGGLLTTCGLHNIGVPCELNGTRYELHGEIHSMPAQNICINEQWDDGNCIFSVSGEVRHSQFYGHDLVLRRTIKAKLGASSFTVEDEVENLDFAPTPVLLLYHTQFGYPFLDSKSKLFTSPEVETINRSGTPEKSIETRNVFAPPSEGRLEECFYRKFKPNFDGFVTAGMFNPDLGNKGMGAYIRYDVSTLPRFIQWKMLRSREYVCGLEPATSVLEKRTDEDLRQVTLPPLGKRKYRLEYGVIEGEPECFGFAGARQMFF